MNAIQSAALAAGVAGGMMSFAANPAAASLVGDSVQIIEYYPAIGDLYGSNGPQTIASGGTSFGALGSSAISGFVSGTQIVFTPELTYTPSPATFNGFDVVDLTSPIASVTLNSSSAPFPRQSFARRRRA